MKKRLLIFNYSLLAAILFTILFQSLHSYEHLIKEFTSEHCHHKYDRNGKAEITHNHHDFDNCLVCKYSFSHYIPTEFLSYSFKRVLQNTSYQFTYTENPIVFSGSLLALRGPPFFIV